MMAEKVKSEGKTEKYFRHSNSVEYLGKKSHITIERRDVYNNRRSFSKIMNMDSSDESSESFSEDESIDEAEWAMDYKEELEYFEINYKIDNTEHWKETCKHNSRVALQIGKITCA